MAGLYRAGSMVGIVSVFGAFLASFPAGSFHTVNNLIPYVESFILKKVDSTLALNDLIWVLSVTDIGCYSFMWLGGYLTDQYGGRPTAFVGCIIFSTFQGLSYFTVQYNFKSWIATFGLLSWIGYGWVYVASVMTASKWFPKQYGLVSGVIGTGTGFGAALLSVLQKRLINPNDVAVNSTITDLYGVFDDDDVLERVPAYFWKTAIIFFTFIILGVTLLFEKPQSEETVNIAQLPSETKSWKEGIQEIKVNFNRTWFMLYTVFLFLQIPAIFIASYFKTYGLSILKDDALMSIVQVIACVGLVLGKLGAGIIADKYSYKVSLVAIALSFGISIQLLRVLPFLSKVAFLYASAVLGLISFSAVAAVYSIVPVCIAQVYGTKHAGSLVGFLCTSQVIGGIISGILHDFLLTLLGWNWTFTFQLSVSLLVCLILMLTRSGKCSDALENVDNNSS